MAARMAGYRRPRGAYAARDRVHLITATLFTTTSSTTRRCGAGRPAVHSRWGTTRHRAPGDYLYIKSMSMALPRPIVVRLLRCDDEDD
jgi:hypothetical protein